MIPARLLALPLIVLLTGAAMNALADSGIAQVESQPSRGDDAGAFSEIVAARADGFSPDGPEAETTGGQRVLELIVDRWAQQSIPPGGLTLPETLGAEVEQFVDRVLALAGTTATARGDTTIGPADIAAAVQRVAPYTLDDGSVTYFSNLEAEQQIVIAAVDLEALRETGIHWRMLAVAIDGLETTGVIDPAGAEVLAEAVASHTLLLLRLAGQAFARLEDSPFVTAGHIHLATRDVTSLATLDGKASGATQSGPPKNAPRPRMDRSQKPSDDDAKRRAWYAAWSLSRDDLDTLQRYAGQLAGLGRTEEAIAIYNEVLLIEPGHDISIWGLAIIYWEERDIPAATKYLEQLVGTGSPLEARSHTMLGMIAGRAGRRDEALAHYQRSVELDPDRADSRVNLGIAYMARGGIDQAYEQFGEALRIKPDAMMPLMYRAKILDIRGDEEAAVVELEKMLALDPQHPRALFNLGRIQERHGRVPAAMEYYRRAHRSATQRGEVPLASEISKALDAP